jgi:hypothetical protein
LALLDLRVAFMASVRILYRKVSPDLTRGPSLYVETFHETSLRHERDDHLVRPVHADGQSRLYVGGAHPDRR